MFIGSLVKCSQLSDNAIKTKASWDNTSFVLTCLVFVRFTVLLFMFKKEPRAHSKTNPVINRLNFFFLKTNLKAGTSSLHFSFEMNLIIYSCACLSKAVTKLNIPLSLLIMFRLASNQFKSVGSPREKNGTYTNNTFAFFTLDWIVILRQNLCLFTDVC